jgi:mycothiol synthase
VPAKTAQLYHPQDAAVLAQIHNRAFPGNQMRPSSFSRHLNDILTIQGQVWTVSDEHGLVGYAYVTPVPGLVGVLDLQGCIDPAKQRQGYGSHLLSVVIASLMANGRPQLSHAVDTLSSPAALFLQSRQFVVEHIEWHMLLENPGDYAPVSFPPGFRLATYPLAAAVRNFRKTYEAAFHGLPWFQPYTSDREVTAELSAPTDLLFLLDNEKIAGFAWLRMPELDLGEVEPFGLLPAYRGKGLGAKFLTAAIQQLVASGAKRIRIGTWQSNDRAIRLYQQLGFKHINTQTYLAYDTTRSQAFPQDSQTSVKLKA